MSAIVHQYADRAGQGHPGFTRQFASKPNQANPTVRFGRGSQRTRLGTSASRAPRCVLAGHGPGGTCLEARGIGDDRITEGGRRSSLDELTKWTAWAEKVITFSAQALSLI